VALALALVLGAACQPDREVVGRDCGLPTPAPGLDPSTIPAPLLLGGRAKPTLIERRADGFTAALNVQMSVGEALEAYRTAVAEAGRRIVGEDNEGFEAELFVRRGDELGMVQVRRSVCDDASVVFLNFVTYPAHERTSAPGPSPTLSSAAGLPHGYDAGVRRP
jgi:hypothetical protein